MTIYKRAFDRNLHLRMKASRLIFSETNQKFPIMTFTARCVVQSRHFLRHCLLSSILQPLIVHVEFFYNKTLGDEEGSAWFGGMCSS
jgi:hypothetical protein